jgi:predicted RNase H-like HicB family nuclease
MERTINIIIEKLPEGLYLATSDEVQGLVAQGRTVIETVEIARDVAKKLIETQGNIELPEIADRFSYPLIIG